MSFTKKLTSVILSLCMVLSLATVAIVPAAAETTVETYAQDTIQGSNILHCFDWSYNNIKANLPDIAKAGYTAVQTSPVQSPKDYNASWTDGSGQWWKLYQPLGFSVSNNTWLGTKDELTSLCAEAEKYNIKVVVDIVANHLANNGADGGTYDNLNSGVDSDLKNSEYYHSDSNGISDDNRYTITQRHMGMPDLNTANSYVQQKALGLLKECIDCGVDGFRFDAAKHIELPTDTADNCASNFWPTVINGAKEYASSKGAAEIFFYGEILGSAGTDISNYTNYMAVTDNQTGDRALDKAYWNAASELADSSYMKGASADKSVLWAESHDTYMGSSGTAYFSNTKSVTSDVIKKTWAIVGARADSTALYFARPTNTMGQASSDITWRSKQITEVNKFKNHFAGQSEYLSSSGSTAYIERGTKGVVISKLDGGGQVSLTANRMSNGTYIDQVSGNKFTVSDGKIKGTVGSSGVAVVYNPDDEAYDTIAYSTLYLKPYSDWEYDSLPYAMYVFNSKTGANAWVSMDPDNYGYYYADLPDGKWTNVIFCQMKDYSAENIWDNVKAQTIDLFPDSGTDCFKVTAKPEGSNYTGTWSEYDPYATDPEEPSTEPQDNTKRIYAIDNAGWNSSEMYVYYWNSNGDGSQWPGVKMTPVSGNNIFTYDIPEDAIGVIFNLGYGKQTADITEGIADGAVFIINDELNNMGYYKYSTESTTYYLVGGMNGWSNDDNYRLSVNSIESGKLEYKLSGVQLNKDEEIKIHSSSDTWYPADVNSNYKVTADGLYDVYFRPDRNGGSDWHYGYIYLYKSKTVTWQNYDGTILKIDDVSDGFIPSYNGDTPVRESTAEKNYTFTGWKKSGDDTLYTDNFPAVTDDVIYTAQFSESPRTYTITWKNGETVLETDQTEYGATPEYNGATPVSSEDSELVFSNWAPHITTVTGDQTYTARFSYNTQSYNITWVDGNGNTLKTDSVLEGVMPAYNGTTPTKASDAQFTYTFNGTWSPKIVAADGDKTYTANFDSTANKYTVTFKDEDGTILDTQEVEYGDMPENPDIPQKESTLEHSYSFSGWTPAVAPVTGDAEYTATYSEMPVSTYNVSVTNAIGWDDVYVYYWKGSENNTWPGVNIKAGGEKFNLTAQIPSTAEGVIFSNGKEGTEKQQTEDITSIKNGAHWAVSLHDNKVTVNEVPTYYLAGTFTDPQWNKDYSPVLSPVKNKDGLEEYKLSGVQLSANDKIKVCSSDDAWYPDEYDATYTVTADGTYDVYFRRNADGDDGWFYNYFSLTNVTPYTITWVDGNGDTIKIDTVIHGETPSYNGTTPVKNSDEQYTYTFTGWSPEIAPATENKTYTAVFDQSVNTYNVIWQNYDGTELANEVYEYGALPTYKGEIPTKASSEMYDYTFAGWTPTVDTVTREITYTAVYDETFRTYTVTFKNWNGDTLYTQEFTYNAYPDYQGETPTKPSDTEHDYLFEGQWSPTLAPVTDDVTYTAQFTEYPRMYHITWYNDDGGTILWETDVPYGMTPEYFGQNPTKMDNEQYHYEFSGWTPDVQPVTGDASYTAQYNEILNTYPVTWRNEDGMLLGQTFVEYGALPVYTGTPEKSADEFYHYNFTGWTPELTPVTGPVEFTAVFTPQPHQFDEPYSVWSTDYQNVEITYHCNDCGYEAHHFVNHTDFAVDIEPKCETSGSGHYYVRDQFGSYDYEIRSEQIEIPAHGHHYGEPVWNWTEDGASATATFSCTECGNTRAEAANIETMSYSAPGCDYQGSANYRAVVNLDGAVYEDTHGVIIPATGHSWGQPTWSWSFDRQFATASFECANCHLTNSYTDDNVHVEYSSEKTTRTATVYFFGEPYSDTIEEEPVQFNINWFSEGSLIKTDSVTYGTTPVYDGETPTKAADPASHYTFTGWQPEIQPAYSNADYYAVFTPESHQYSEPYSVDWNIDSKYVEITYRCSVCGHEEIHRVILSEYNFVVDTPSTCTVQGTGHYHVNDMNVSVDSDPVAIPVTDHSYGQPEWSWADDYKSATATFTCGICGDVQCVTTTDVAIDYQNDKTVYTAKAVFNGIEYRNTAEADAKLFAGHSLTLNKNNDGDIGVNFFINVSEADVDRGVTVNFEWTVNGNTKRSSYKLDKAKDFVTDHRYKASCFVAAAEMTFDINATVTIGDELKEETNIYSVKRYADKILVTSTDEKLINLIQAMLDYGTRAQFAFDRTQPGLANGGTYYLTYNVNASDISGVEDDMREKLSDYGLEYVGSTIVYLTKSTLRHYYKVSDADTFNNYKGSITMDGAAVSFSKNGEMIYCDVKNIGAYELDTVHTLKIGDTDYDYSVLTYLKKSIASDKTSDNTKELCKATYRYYVAAKAYFG